MEENFYEKVYLIVKKIPRGYVTTYGTIARALGRPHMSRQVGYALHKNTNPDEIPCHRVVFMDGRLASSYVFGGEKVQLEKLKAEGVKFTKNKKGEIVCEKKNILLFLPFDID